MSRSSTSRSTTPSHPSRPDRPSPARPRASGLPPARLEALGRTLLDAAVAVPGCAELVGVLDPASHPHGGPDGPVESHLVVVDLPGDDPVAALLGFTAPDRWCAVGLVTDGLTRPLERRPDRVPVTFVHLLDRAGTRLALLATPGGEPVLTGPDREVVGGRILDLLRRVLGMPTAPPPGDMTAHVVDVWLALVTRAALDRPDLGWAEVVALHPADRLLAGDLHHPLPPARRDPPTGAATDVLPTPAEMAARTAAFGAALDWERYRQLCATSGGTPFGELSGERAAWLDAGAFARWLTGETAAWPTAMDWLDGLLPGPTADHLWATLTLCPPPPWPPPGP